MSVSQLELTALPEQSFMEFATGQRAARNPEPITLRTSEVLEWWVNYAQHDLPGQNITKTDVRSLAVRYGIGIAMPWAPDDLNGITGSMLNRERRGELPGGMSYEPMDTDTHPQVGSGRRIRIEEVPTRQPAQNIAAALKVSPAIIYRCLMATAFRFYDDETYYQPGEKVEHIQPYVDSLRDGMETLHEMVDEGTV